MNDRQREIIDAATDRIHRMREGADRAELHAELYQLALDVLSPHAADDEATTGRRSPTAGEVLPREQRATWARDRTYYDAE